MMDSKGPGIFLGDFVKEREVASLAYLAAYKR
jgi:hypothetical protein